MEFPDPKYREICSLETLRSSKQGFFSSFSSVVIERVGKNWINGVFAQKQLEEDKIRICCRESNVWNAIQEVLQNVKPFYREKSSAAAKAAREEGEKLMQEKNYKKAAMFFSQSIIRSPGLNVDCTVDNGLSLPLAYKCRANAWYHLEQYKECLTDLALSIKEGLPSSIKHQAFCQMGKCHKELMDEKKCKISLEVALKMVEDQITIVKKANKVKESKQNIDKYASSLVKDREEIKKILSTLNNKKNLEKAIELPDTAAVTHPLPGITGPANERYPSASKLITIKQSAETGRFAAAAGSISTGDTLVVEAPYASCLIPEKFSSHCHHCYSRLNAAIPCKTCSGVAFCSTECRDASTSTYHKYECQFLGLFIGSGMSILSFLSLRMMTQEGIEFFRELQQKIRLLQSEKENNLTFTPKETNYLSIYRLVTHSNIRLNEDYFTRALMAIFLVKCLKKTDFFQNESSKVNEELSEDEILAASLILRHLQVLQFNAHEIYKTKVEKPGKTKGAKSVYIAVGIYPTVALFNHECSPAVTRYFHGKNIIIRAVRPIKKGDMISENYGPVFTKKSRPERLRELTSRYWFKCECDACFEDWPKLETLDDQHFRLRCKTADCTGLLKNPTTLEKPHTQRCQKCFNKINLADVLEHLSRLETLFDKAIQHMDSGECDRAVPLLTAYLEEVFRLGAPPSREISLCQEALRTCYAQTGNVWISD